MGCFVRDLGTKARGKTRILKPRKVRRGREAIVLLEISRRLQLKKDKKNKMENDFADRRTARPQNSEGEGLALF